MCTWQDDTEHITIVSQYDRKGRQYQGDSPTPFEKCCRSVKVPRIGLVEVGMQRCHANFNASFEANLRITDDIHNVLIDVLIDTLL